LLADLILENNPDNIQLRNGKRDATINRWADDIDRLMRIDKQTPGRVESVIRWCQADNFWQGNILSGKKLREKWNSLTVKMNGNAPDRSQDDYEQATLGAAL
jgi:hypothetical protein